MIYRRPKSYSITLKRAHALLKIPKSSNSNTSIENDIVNNRPSREQIQSAFRTAAKLHHPDLINTTNSKIKMNDKNTTFRECHEARELLLDYYTRRKYIHPEILQSVKDKPPPDYMEEGSWSSVLNSIKSNRSFQVEACMRLSLCLALAVGTYMHDLNKPKRLEMQKRRRDAQYAQFGPQPRF